MGIVSLNVGAELCGCTPKSVLATQRGFVRRILGGIASKRQAQDPKNQINRIHRGKRPLRAGESGFLCPSHTEGRSLGSGDEL